jgi:hypothetical protein
VLFLTNATALAQSRETTAGWQASQALADTLTKRRPDTIYLEERVPDYTLPDPLLLSDGTKVTDPAIWRERRRPEILALFGSQVYGLSPPKPAQMHFEVFDLDTLALQGKALRKQVTVYFQSQKAEPSMDILIYLPSRIRKAAPVFLILNFSGNHSVRPDPAIRLSARWMRNGGAGVVNNRATEASRGSKQSRYPVEYLLERGYGLATIYYGDLDPDHDDGFQNGVHAFFDAQSAGERRPDAWGAIGAWAWGLSRAMDYFETDDDIDEQRVAVIGHSRLGKTSLWAGARDQRFAMVISNNSGCGGAALSRRRFGESVARINSSFPHWFCDNFNQYGGRENELPVDQHLLLALIAPRPVYVASADQDLWADPRGEFLACKHAEPVYHLYGMPGLEAQDMPALDRPVQLGRIAYHVRTGGHDLSAYDWHRYLDFADRFLQ